MAPQRRRVLLQCSIIYLCIIASVWTAIDATREIARPPYGYPCNSDSSCRIDSKYNTMFPDRHKCIDEVCDCDESRQYRVFKNGNYKCPGRYELLYDNTGECSPIEPDTCIDGTCKKWRCLCQDDSVLVGNSCRKSFIANLTDDCNIPESGPVPVCDYKKSMFCNNTDMKCACLNFTLSENMESASELTGPLFYDGESETCLSSKDYSEKYPNETLAGLDEYCGIKEGIPKVCEEENMHCKDSKCKCKRNFYPVKSIGTCESYQSYVDAHNLTSGYKVAPGLYCYNNDDCITGLVCHKNLCDCPYPCTYNNVTIVCDCGAVSATEGASSAILIGIIGGFLIIIFWYRMIRKTMDKGKEKSQHNSSYNDVTSEPPPDNTYSPPMYDISPNHYPSATTYDTNDEDIPLKPPTVYTDSSKPNSTSNPPYPISTSSTTNPSTNAPLYPLNPSNNAPPPPYNPNPATNTPPYPSTNAPPYPPNYSQPAGPVGFSTFPESNSSAIPPTAPPYGVPSDGFVPPPYTPTNQNDNPGDDIYKPIIY